MTDTTTDAIAAGFHYDVTPERGLCLNHSRHPVLIATKPHHLVRVAGDCMTGLLRVDVNGDPVQIVDHPWLLRLAAGCCGVAAQLMERN